MCKMKTQVESNLALALNIKKENVCATELGPLRERERAREGTQSITENERGELDGVLGEGKKERERVRARDGERERERELRQPGSINKLHVRKTSESEKDTTKILPTNC
jgi:hypothetical protein